MGKDNEVCTKTKENMKNEKKCINHLAEMT